MAEKDGMTEHMFECYNKAVAAERRYIVNTNESEPISDKRAAALALIQSGLPLGEFLSSAGISEKDAREWLEDEEFLADASSLAEKFAHANEPFVWSVLLSLIGEKNLQAIRLYFTVAEKRRTAAQRDGSAPDSEIESLRSDIFGEAGDDV